MFLLLNRKDQDWIFMRRFTGAKGKLNAPCGDRDRCSGTNTICNSGICLCNAESYEKNNVCRKYNPYLRKNVNTTKDCFIQRCPFRGLSETGFTFGGHSLQNTFHHQQVFNPRLFFHVQAQKFHWEMPVPQPLMCVKTTMRSAWMEDVNASKSTRRKETCVVRSSPSVSSVPKWWQEESNTKDSLSLQFWLYASLEKSQPLPIFFWNG